MYTYGYIREATMAHIDLDETEAQAMNLQARFHIWANEAVQAICVNKPKYKYFEATVVKEFDTVIESIDANNNLTYRLPTEDERYYLKYGVWPEGHTPSDESAPQVADSIATTEFYHAQYTYLLNEIVTVGDDFLAFADRQAYKVKKLNTFDKEKFIEYDLCDNMCEDITQLVPANYKTDFMYTGNNSITFLKEGTYKIPYKAIWFRFKSGIADTEEIDMPMDIFVCIPLYIASVALQIDYMQKAQIKRSEFEIALARVTSGDKMPLNSITPTFR